MAMLQPNFLGNFNSVGDSPNYLDRNIEQFFAPPMSASDIQTQATMQEAGRAKAAQQVAEQQQAAQQQALLSEEARNLLGGVPRAQEQQQAQELLPLLSRNYQPMSYADRQLANLIVAQKQAYDVAQKRGDAEGMAQAAQNAQYLRQFAEAQGADMSNYGAGQTLQQGLLGLQADANAGLRQVLDNDITSGEYYRRIYAQERQAGKSKRSADKTAASMAADYQAQRIRKLQQAFTNYGVTNDGAINDMGAFLMQRMAGEQPSSMAVYDNGYAKPKDMYELAAQLTKMGMTDFYNAQGQQRAFGYNQRGADAQQARAKDMATFNANLTMEQKTALANLELQTQGLALQQKQDIYYNWFKQAGLDDNSAALMAIQYASGGGRGNGSGNSGAGTQGQGMYSKDQIDVAKSEIKAYNDYIAAGGDPDKYSGMNDYKAARQIMSNILTGGQGAQANAEIPIADPTGDWNTDKATIDQMTSIMRAYGTSDDEIAKAVYLHFSKELGEDYGKKALNYWKNGEKQEKPKDTPATRAARGDGSKASNTPARRVVVDVQGGNAEDIADDNAGTGNGIIPIFGRGLKRIGEVTGLAPNPNKLLNGR